MSHIAAKPRHLWHTGRSHSLNRRKQIKFKNSKKLKAVKNSIYLLLVLGFILLADCAAPEKDHENGKAVLMNNAAVEKGKEDRRAKEGQNTLLIINYVREESKMEYEKFMNEVFFDLLLSSKKPLMKEQYNQTRWLTPSKQNKDKTWTYVFFMDPVVKNGDYEFLPLFQEKYSEEEAKSLIEQHDSYMASPPDIHALIQTKH